MSRSSWRRRLVSVLAVGLLSAGCATLAVSAPASATDPATAAVSWAEARLGQHIYDGLCLQFVADAYASAGIDIGSSSSAVTYWNSHQSLQHASDTNPPVGALVFWDATTGTYANPDGHVALSIGNGVVISSYERSNHNIHEFAISDRNNAGYPYLGWMMPPGVSAPGGGTPPPPPAPKLDFNNDGYADIAVVNTQNTGSGQVEVHPLSGSTNYSAWLGHDTTPASYLDSTQQVVTGDVNYDNHTDVAIVNTTNTGSGYVEVHLLSGATNFSTWLGHYVTPASYLDSTQRVVMADFNGDHFADLGIVDTANTGSGKVELHILSGATGFSQWLGHYVTTADYLSSTQRVVAGDFNGDGLADLAIVNTQNTGSGYTEVHILNAVGGFSQWMAHDVTPMGYLDSSQQVVAGDVNNDGHDDISIVNTVNTGSGYVEVHPLSGSTNFSTWLGHYTTPASYLDSTQRVVSAG